MIIVNARFLTQRITGVQRYAIEICKRLPKEIAGEEIFFITPKVTLYETQIDKEKIISIGYLKGQLWEQIELPFFLKKKGNPLLINFVGIGPVFYKRKIFFLYDLAFKHHPEWFSFVFQKMYNTFIPISLKNSLSIIVDSNYVKEDVIKTYDIKNKKIDVIYAAPAKMFSNLNSKKEKIILTVSSIDPRKNLTRVINAFNLIETDYKLVIVGSKNKTFSNVNLNKGIENDNIIFTGYLNDEELINLYNKSDIFIYASLFEGFGIPPLEAQACGCPVIVSNVTSLPEVCLDSVEYCDPYKINSIKLAMESLFKNVERRSELTKKGLDNIKRFDWSRSTMKFIKIVERSYEKSTNS